MRLIVFVFASLIALGIPKTPAQQFPSQPVRVVVPFPPGGGTDILVRLIQDKYAARLGQPVVIDNRPGASGNIGGGVVAKSKPDGYTLLVQATIVGIYPTVFASLPYDPLTDFAWIGGVAESPAVIVTNPNSRYKTIGDLMAEAKARPKQVNFASAGVGSPQHLATERLGKLNNVEFTHVPYKGSATAVTDLLSGVLDFGTLSFSSVLPLIKEGKLRALALAHESRSKLMPDVPTLKESGLGDISGTVRFIIGAPTGTPDAAVERLSADLNAVVKDPDIQEGFEKRGYEITLATPKEVLAMVREQKELWDPLVRELKLKFD